MIVDTIFAVVISLGLLLAGSIAGGIWIHLRSPPPFEPDPEPEEEDRVRRFIRVATDRLEVDEDGEVRIVIPPVELVGDDDAVRRLVKVIRIGQAALREDPLLWDSDYWWDTLAPREEEA